MRPAQGSLAARERCLNTFDRQLAKWAADRPDATAFTFLRRGEEPEGRLTFAELDRRARQIAAQLIGGGLNGRPVALIYPAGLGFIEAFCGCLYAGVIAAALPLPANARAAGRCAAICQAADFAAILTVTSQLGAEALGPVRAALPEAPWICTDTSWEDADGVHLEAQGAAAAFLQFTSGSTTEPKGVVITHDNLAANQAMIAEAFGHDQDTRVVSWLPMHHDMGLIGTVLQPIHLGIPSVLMSPQSFLQKPVRWLRAISRHRATTAGAPNFGYAACLDRISPEACADLDLSTWRLAFCGAEPVQPLTLRRFAERFGAVGFDASSLFPCYGMAEATLFVSGGPTGSGLKVARVADGRDVASCGRGWGRQTITIVDPELRTAKPPGEPGEIWLAGPHIARAYSNNREATLRTFEAKLIGSGAPQLRTGDIGFMKGGELFVTGRMKDLLIVRGANIHPEDVEETVRRSDTILAGAVCAAFATTEDDHRITVVVELPRRSGGADRHAGLAKAAAAAIVAEHGFAPSEILLVNPGVIPRTTSGKVPRQACRDAYLKARLGEPADERTP